MRAARLIGGVAAGCLLLGAWTKAWAAEAIFAAVDKVTARVSQIAAPVDQPVWFGPLEITVKACVKRPQEETPENAAFVKVTEQRPPTVANPQGGIVPVFSGWMFASSPALNAMEHPVYDLQLLDCR